MPEAKTNQDTESLDSLLNEFDNGAAKSEDSSFAKTIESLKPVVDFAKGEMVRRDVKKGLATMCIGGGMGVALCVER